MGVREMGGRWEGVRWEGWRWEGGRWESGRWEMEEERGGAGIEGRKRAITTYLAVVCSYIILGFMQHA